MFDRSPRVSAIAATAAVPAPAQICNANWLMETSTVLKITFVGLVALTMQPLASETASVGAPPASESAESSEAMPASEIKCLLTNIEIDAKTAQSTAESIAEATSLLKFNHLRFNRVSLLHFLAQIKSESGAGKEMTQIGNQSREKKGYGLNQVTGSANLRAAEKCMNLAKPGPPRAGQGVTSDPEHTIGRHGNPLKSALASLCWWQQNIANNESHYKISLQATADAVKKITEISNSGHIGGSVTNGQKSISIRQKTFDELKQAENLCRES